MTAGKSFDHQQALSDPCRVFGEPANVLSHPDLDARQKREILENWWQDGLRMSESATENMGGGEEPMLKRVRDALRELERQTGAGSEARKRPITS